MIPRWPRSLQAVLIVGWFGVVPLLFTLVVVRHLLLPLLLQTATGGAFEHWLRLHPAWGVVGAFAIGVTLLGYWVRFLPDARRWLPQGRAFTPVSSGWMLSALSLAGFACLTAPAGQRLGVPERVAGLGMLPSLLPGDYAWVRGERAGRGDVVAVTAPDESVRVARVIGLPGDFISLRAGRPRINGWEVPACSAGRYWFQAAGERVHALLLVEFLENRAYLALGVPSAASLPEFQVPAGELFVLGDNRVSVSPAAAGGVALSAVVGGVERKVDSDALRSSFGMPAMFSEFESRLTLPGLDVADLRAGVARCLASPPRGTNPPSPNAPTAAAAEANGVVR